MNKKLIIVLVAILFTASFGVSASAETGTTSDRPVTSIEELIKMIARLQAQIKTLSGQSSGGSVAGGMVVGNTEEKFEFKQELRKGVQGDDVMKLQRVLASDKAIYPEGLTTGFFGDRTGEALKKFQAKFGLEVTGEFDPKTRELVNKILWSQGAKKEIPMGLLVAPGLRERVKVRLENSNGKFEYKIDVDDSDDSDDSDDDEDDDSDDDSDSRLKIEVEDKSHDKSKVKVELRNGFSEAKRVFLLNTRDHDEIISIIAGRLGVTKAEVSSVIKFESDDDEDDDSGDDDSDDSDDSDDDDEDGDDDEDDDDDN